MNLSTTIFLMIILLTVIVFDKIFGDDLDKILKVILFGFTPLGILMWLSEIIISKHISVIQFGFIYIAFNLLSLGAVSLFKVLKNKVGSIEGRAIGFCYIVVLFLAFLLIVFTNAYIETYFKHNYLLP